MLAVLLSLLFWSLFVLVPIGALGFRLISSGTVLTKIFEPEILSILVVTLKQALWSVGISVLVGLLLGLWLGVSRKSFSRLTHSILSIPYAVPTVVAGTAWVLWLGRSGILVRVGVPLDWAYSLKAVILAHVFYNIPFVALLVAQSRESLPHSQIEAASSLGAGAWFRFRYIIWPHIRWALAVAAVQVFSLCVMSFALVLILGGGPPVDTLETALYSRIRGGTLDISSAAVCALWQLVLTLLPWAFVLWRGRKLKGRVACEEGQSRTAGCSSPVREWVLFVVAVFFVLPYFAVFSGVSSILGSSSDFWSQLQDPLFVSVKLALWSSVGSVILASLCVLAWRALRLRSGFQVFLSALLAMPSGVSMLVIGLGFWLAYGRFVDPFDGSFLAMVILQMVCFYPLVFRMFLPVAKKMPERQWEAAMSLGAGKFQAFRLVEWPRWRKVVFASLAMVAGASLGEVAAVSLFYSENLISVPLLISRWMGQYRFEQAQALSALLLVLVFVCVGVVNWVGREPIKVTSARK